MTGAHRQRGADSEEPTTTAVPSFARLIRTELHRFTARRFVRVTLLLGLLAYIAGLSTVWLSHRHVDAADRAQATVQRDEQLKQQDEGYRQCVAQAPQGQADQQCGQPLTATDFPIDNFFHNHPLQPEQLRDFAADVGVGAALIGFVLGASFVGAEWSSKNLIAWLFWEPRRLRLLTAKVLAVLSVTLALSAAAQLVLASISRVLLRDRGVPVSLAVPPEAHFWSGFAAVQGRAAVLVVATALLGFGLANLIRNTAAAFAVGFVYFAVVETVVRRFNHHLDPYLFTTSVAAWLNRHGVTVVVGSKYDPKQNFSTEETVHVSNLHGGVALLIYAGAVTILSAWLFRRRDIA